MPRTRKPKALSSATDTQEASPAPRSTAKPTTRKRKAPEKAPVIIADSPAAKSQFRVKRVKKVNPAPATEAQAKAPETSEAGRADGPVRENYAITPAQSMKRTTAAVAPAASGSTKPTKSTKSTKSRNGKQSTATTPKKHFPAPSSERRPRNWLHEPPKAFLDRAKRAKTEK
jgi:hypothetical protein